MVREGVASIALLPCGSISGHFVQLPNSICFGLYGTGTRIYTQFFRNPLMGLPAFAATISCHTVLFLGIENEDLPYLSLPLLGVDEGGFGLMEKHPNLSGEGYPHVKLELRMYIGCFSYTHKRLGNFTCKILFLFSFFFCFVFMGLDPSTSEPQCGSRRSDIRIRIIF